MFITVTCWMLVSYLMYYKSRNVCVSLSSRALRHCEEMIQRYSREVSRSSSGTLLPNCSNSSVGKAVQDCMRAVIGVLLNLTHDNGESAFASQRQQTN